MPLLILLILLVRAVPGVLRALVSALLPLLRRVVAPPRCAACDDPSGAGCTFCDGCARSVERAAATPEGLEIAYARYSGAVAEAVKRFKYSGRSDLARPLAALLRRAVRDARLAGPSLRDVALVVPVPLHPRKLRRRGYNQVALLAGPVAAELRVPFGARALARARDTTPQASLDAEDRRKNLCGAFLVRDARPIRGRHILLVDDVRTTGSTAAACREALLAAGAARVTTVVLAVADNGADFRPG